MTNLWHAAPKSVSRTLRVRLRSPGLRYHFSLAIIPLSSSLAIALETVTRSEEQYVG